MLQTQEPGEAGKSDFKGGRCWDSGGGGSLCLLHAVPAADHSWCCRGCNMGCNLFLCLEEVRCRWGPPARVLLHPRAKGPSSALPELCHCHCKYQTSV